MAMTIAAAVSPTQAAVYFSFMSPHPLLRSCDSSVRRTVPGATDMSVCRMSAVFLPSTLRFPYRRKKRNRTACSAVSAIKEAIWVRIS
ncbi:hypothetical protein GCM10023257_63630 [Streptomyces hyderabadensis]|uniref:Secreted protein n=1 Tax=Streptomyces hyderabadensis TaxID=598549 RepID=A0ABP9ISP2_9ACTN